MLVEIQNELRYSVRMLLKKPGFTAIAVMTMALGIGVNTALFTGFNIFLRPKPVKDPDTIVRLQFEGGAARSTRFSFADYGYLRNHTQVFSEVIAAQEEEKFLLGGNAADAKPEEILGNFVSDHYFDMLGGTAGSGRLFSTAENEVPGRDAVVVLSYRFWQRRFGGDSQAIGRSLVLNGKSFTIIGVTSPAYVGLRYEVPDIWVPLAMRSAMPTVHFEGTAPEKRDWFGGSQFRWLTLHARLKPARTIDEARAEMDVLLGQLAQLRGPGSPEEAISVASISELRADNKVWPLMAMVMGASGLVLLIACFNLANMQLARAVARQKEISVRLCLGAARSRLVRQLLIESLLLAGLGCLGGVLFAWWSLDLFLTTVLSHYGSADVARLAVDISPDARVLGFSLLLALASAIGFGLVPALQATNPALLSTIKDEGANTSTQATRSRLRRTLVVAQVALCLLLLIPAGLLIRSLQKVLATDPGFAAKNLILFGYSLELSGYDAKRAELFQQQLIARLQRMPGVQSVSLDRNFNGRATITLLDETGRDLQQFGPAPAEGISENYLQTIGTPLLQGRNFTTEEVAAKAPVVIVSESTGRNLWPGQNPVGKSLRLNRQSRVGGEVVVPPAHVIGVARDNQTYEVGLTPPLFVYRPEAISDAMDTTILVRTTVDAASMKETLRQQAYALEPVLRLFVNTAAENIAEDAGVQSARAVSEGASALGGFALLLAAMGLYGVMAWSVAQRTREIGIRMALGAERRDVLALVLKHGMGLVLLGVVIGFPLSLAAMQLMKGFMFGMGATDPVAFASVIGLLLLVGLAACYLPARRATKVDPIVSLRSE